jgi:hypothetical protein
MIPDAIEKETLIAAPVETVYRVITEPAQIAQWFSDAAELAPVPGSEGRLTFEILSLVARGRIVHPTSSTVPIFGRDDIILIPIDDLPPIPLGLVWCTSRENPRIRALDDVARSMITPPSATRAPHAGYSGSG